MSLRKLKGALGLSFQKLRARKRFLEDFQYALKRQGGSKDCILTLSFDCDTDDDMKVIPSLLDSLDELQINASFALCGELALRFRDEARAITGRGHEVLNHGYSIHSAAGDSGETRSTLFYSQLLPEQIGTEIKSAHGALTDLLGVAVRGFRTPHFGTFSSRENLHLIYGILKSLEYSYSSSTCGGCYPLSYWRDFDLIEIPLTQCPWHPGTPFDSWHILAAPGREHRSSDLVRLFRRMTAWIGEDGSSRLLNVYFDPSHMIENREILRMFLKICGSERLSTMCYDRMISNVDLSDFKRDSMLNGNQGAQQR